MNVAIDARFQKEGPCGLPLHPGIAVCVIRACLADQADSAPQIMATLDLPSAILLAASHKCLTGSSPDTS